MRDRAALREGASQRAAVPTFASLAVRDYRLLFISGTISFLAVQAQIIARGWLANELTGTNAGLGGVYMAFGVPMLLAIPFGGVLADRLSKRSIMLWMQVVLVASSAWLGFGVAFGFVEYWMLLVASALQAVAFSFIGPARMAMTSELVGRDLITNAVVLGQMSINSTRVFGPALAGIGIGVAWFGTAGVYFSSAALSVIGMAVLLPLPPGRGSIVGSRRSPGREFVDSLSYVKARPEVALLLVTSFVVVMAGFPYLAFLPRVATTLHGTGAMGYGLLSGGTAIGALAVSTWIAGRGSRRSPWLVQLATGTGFGVSLLLLALSPSFVTALIAVCMVGAGSSGFQAINNSLALNLSDFEYHGRIQSLMMLSFSGFGMAALPLGTLADGIGLRQMLAVMAIVVVGATVVSTLLRRRYVVERQSTSLA